MDRWCQKHQKHPYDKDGSWASQGDIDSRLMQTLLEDTYFHAPPPKSTGTEYFNLEWLEHKLQEHPDVDGRDVQASLLALTASTITQAIQGWAADAEEILVCGGGVHNRALMRALSHMLSPQPVASTDSIDHGIHPDWVEATAFAWLAKQTVDGSPGNLPSVTGARHPVILGGIYPY
jgi:anhydro-N-acetylmuramic acid kinase